MAAGEQLARAGPGSARQRQKTMAGAITSIKWQWFVLCGAILIVMFVGMFTEELSPEAIERWSVDAKRWEHQYSAANPSENHASLPPAPPGKLKVFGGAPSKADEAAEEAAGLGHHVHTFHDSSGDVHATSVKGVLPVQEHRDVQTHLSRPPTEPLEKYSKPHALPEMPPPEMLLSKGAVVVALVRGNLGPASSVRSPVVALLLAQLAGPAAATHIFKDMRLLYSCSHSVHPSASLLSAGPSVTLPLVLWLARADHGR